MGRFLNAEVTVILKEKNNKEELKNIMVEMQN